MHVGVGVFWVELNGFRVVGNGAVQIALGFLNTTTVEVGGGVLWVEVNGFRIVSDGTNLVAIRIFG
jgi:hypothetical protein